MKKKKQEVYELTLKGLLHTVINDHDLIDRMWDAIELYSYRHKKNAILLEDFGRFIDVEIEK
jgi:hypothetical protein